MLSILTDPEKYKNDTHENIWQPALNMELTPRSERVRELDISMQPKGKLSRERGRCVGSLCWFCHLCILLTLFGSVPAADLIRASDSSFVMAALAANWGRHLHVHS